MSCLYETYTPTRDAEKAAAWALNNDIDNAKTSLQVLQYKKVQCSSLNSIFTKASIRFGTACEDFFQALTRNTTW